MDPCTDTDLASLVDFPVYHANFSLERFIISERARVPETIDEPTQDTSADEQPDIDASAAVPEDLDLDSSSESGLASSSESDESHQFGAYLEVPDNIQSASGSEFSGESTSDDESESDETSYFVHGDLDVDDDTVSGDKSPIPDVVENLRVNVNDDDQDTHAEEVPGHGADEDHQEPVGDDHPVQDTDEGAYNDENDDDDDVTNYQPEEGAPNGTNVDTTYSPAAVQDALEAEDAATAHTEPQLAGDEGPIHVGDVVSRLIMELLDDPRRTGNQPTRSRKSFTSWSYSCITNAGTRPSSRQ